MCPSFLNVHSFSLYFNVFDRDQIFKTLNHKEKSFYDIIILRLHKKGVQPEVDLSTSVLKMLIVPNHSRPVGKQSRMSSVLLSWHKGGGGSSDETVINRSPVSCDTYDV